MKISLRIVLVFATLSTLSIPLIADEFPAPPPIEWGEISKADLEMRTFPGDSNASAVILCDYGETSVNANVELEYRRHLRVKILNQKGFEWGTHSVFLYTDNERGETIDDIEGITYTLDPNGDINEVEFDDDDVFEEKVDDKYSRYKFTLPGLQAGCIIEIRYTITSQNLYSVKDWVFQYSEPVLWSEYRLLFPVALGFSVVKSGYEKLAADESSEVRNVILNAPSFYGSNPIRCQFMRMAIQNADAIRDEPYITTIDDYITKADVQFAGYAYEGMVTKVYDTWDKTVKDLLESKYIGGKIDVTGKLEDEVKRITARAKSPEDTARAIYSWISSSIVWSGKNRIFADQEVNETLESKKGNSAEITYLLISMLTAAGIPAQPVILSTRDHGRLQTLYPILNQFNYVIARATIGGRTMFLDATNPHRPMEVLPRSILNVPGLVLQHKKVEWITFASPVKSTTIANAVISLDENGIARGTIEGIFKEYANLDIRTSLKESKSAETAKNRFATEASGFTVDSVTVEASDTVSIPVRMKAWVSSQTFAQSSGDLIYVNPHVVSRWKDNPFKSRVRKFPIDYNYPRDYVSIVNVTIPDSFEVKEGLKDKIIALNNNAVKYRRISVVNGQLLQLTTKFEIVSREVGASYYQQLKDLYGAMIAMESEQIVLQRKPTPPPAPAVPVSPVEEKKSSGRKKK